MLPLTNEEKIIFLASRLNPSKRDVKDIVHIITNSNQKIDYTKLTQLSSFNGVAPLLYKNLKPLKIIPEEVLSKLRNIYLSSIAENLQKTTETLKILQALKDKGIVAISIKGAIASEIIFEDPGLYYGTDIDILVRPSDLHQVKQILIDSGYSYDEMAEKAMLASHYHLVFYNHRHTVEVHWNLVKRYFDIPPEFWWHDAQKGKYEDIDILFLSLEKYLMYTVFRLFSHMFYPLKFFVLISEISNKYYGSINWDQFASEIKKYKMMRLTTFTFKILNEFLGTKVHNKFLTKNIIGYDYYKRTIMNKLFKEVKRPYLSKILYVFLLDSPHYIFDSFIKRMWPEEDELRLRYKIPEGSKTIYFYYILNPLLLPLMLLRRPGKYVRKLTTRNTHPSTRNP
jgi:hypothetical protein